MDICAIKDLDEAIKLAGFTKTSIVGEMHKFRSTDPREKDIGEGHNPIQIILDQAAHLMDAVALGEPWLLLYPMAWKF